MRKWHKLEKNKCSVLKDGKLKKRDISECIIYKNINWLILVQAGQI